ncbi:glycosyltransferase family 2 protein [Paenibacillus oceani]|uniref:Glycosyltransferase family 2 protein n=1 Tax=Paenibacillus oceani TaxID=2772510 RepID=A0A927H1Y3_9BACL|nr:glycosyltransferase family 2 protein [Paenibacillus oceani]MBD2864813.1 glycosyltransferase family 2 protein [Paenibacillus oceani]
MNYSVTVHIVTYNSERYIANCINSLEGQTYPIERIFVLDNASKDDTKNVVNQFSKVLFFQNENNRGFAPAHNDLIRMTNSDFVLVLNPDVILDPNYISKIIDKMQSNPQLGSATGTLLLQSNTSLVDSTGITIEKSRRAFDRGAGDNAEKWKCSSEIFGVSGAAAVYRRTMIEDLSFEGDFFDSDFFAYKEDVDVSWRANLLGWKAYYVNDAIGYHVRGWQQGKRSQQPLFIRKKSYINRYKMIFKNETFNGFAKDFFYITFYEIISNTYILIKEPKVLVAWFDFYRSIPALLRKRKWIQKRKRNLTQFL